MCCLHAWLAPNPTCTVTSAEKCHVQALAQGQMYGIKSSVPGQQMISPSSRIHKLASTLSQ